MATLIFQTVSLGFPQAHRMLRKVDCVRIRPSCEEVDHNRPIIVTVGMLGRHP